LEINNGQKLHLIQTVTLLSKKPINPPALYDQKAAGIEAKVSWQAQGTDYVRIAELTVDQPLVAPSDYPAVRKILREWSAQLSQ